MQVMRDEPENPPTGEHDDAEHTPAPFEAPHSNGAVHHPPPPRRGHAPWEFIILGLFVAILCILIILGWTLVGSHSPERLDQASAAAVSAACDKAQSQLKLLANPDPRQGADRVARIRAEDGPLQRDGHGVRGSASDVGDPGPALQAWSTDWGRMIDARARYADDLEHAAGTDKKVRLIYPAATRSSR